MAVANYSSAPVSGEMVGIKRAEIKDGLRMVHICDLDLILAVKLVDDLEAATDHIRSYGSRHTEVILTEDAQAADRFLAAVDSAGVYHNCSSRFADGFRYGFGAEVGISTQTLPPRGPVGLEGLVTYRYRLRGEGHIAADYANGSRIFTHIDRPL